MRQHSKNFSNNDEGATDVATATSDLIRWQPLTPSIPTSQHNTRTYTTSLLIPSIAQSPNIQTLSTMCQLPRVSPLKTHCSRIMLFLPQATTTCNLPCPSHFLQALSPIRCWTQPSNSLIPLSLSLSIHSPQLRPTSQPPTPSTVSLQLPTPFLQAAEVWPTTQPTWRMCCMLCSQSASEISVRKKDVNSADLTSTGEGRTGDVNSEPP